MMFVASRSLLSFLQPGRDIKDDQVPNRAISFSTESQSQLKENEIPGCFDTSVPQHDFRYLCTGL